MPAGVAVPVVVVVVVVVAKGSVVADAVFV